MAAPHRLEEVESKVYPGLERSAKKNWVEKAGGLPSYIERVAKHLHYEKGYAISRAIATAVNHAKKMCASGTAFGGQVKVSGKAKAVACKAVAEWEAKKGKAKVSEAVMSEEDELSLVQAAEIEHVMIEGLLMTLRDRGAGKPAKRQAVANAFKLLEGKPVTDWQDADRNFAATADRLKRQRRMLDPLVEAAASYKTLVRRAEAGKLKGRGGEAARDPEFEKKHPRAPKGRTGGGEWITSDSPLGGAVASKIGAKGEDYEAAVRSYQEENDLAVDGLVGHQTAAALLGRKGASKVTPGALTDEDRKRLRKKLMEGRAELEEAFPVAEIGAALAIGSAPATLYGAVSAAERAKDFVKRKQAGGSIIDFDPKLHPRDRVGKFIEVLEKLTPDSEVRLPGGTRVIKRTGGLFDVKGRWGVLDEEYARSPRGVAAAVLGEGALAEAPLTGQTRKNLPSSSFVFPKERRYPIHDISHARNALARSSGKPEEATVRAAVYKRYPQLKKKKVSEAAAKCPHCGYSIKPGEKKCSHCGRKLEEAEARAERKERSEKHHKIKCPKCDAVQSASNAKCSNCGHDLGKARKAKFAKLEESEEEPVLAHPAIVFAAERLEEAVQNRMASTHGGSFAAARARENLWRKRLEEAIGHGVPDIDWNPKWHPRSRVGRFVEVPDYLEKAYGIGQAYRGTPPPSKPRLTPESLKRGFGIGRAYRGVPSAPESRVPTPRLDRAYGVGQAYRGKPPTSKPPESKVDAAFRDRLHARHVLQPRHINRVSTGQLFVRDRAVFRKTGPYTGVAVYPESRTGEKIEHHGKVVPLAQKTVPPAAESQLPRLGHRGLQRERAKRKFTAQEIEDARSAIKRKVMVELGGQVGPALKSVEVSDADAINYLNKLPPAAKSDVRARPHAEPRELSVPELQWEREQLGKRGGSPFLQQKREARRRQIDTELRRREMPEMPSDAEIRPKVFSRLAQQDPEYRRLQAEMMDAPAGSAERKARIQQLDQYVKDSGLMEKTESAFAPAAEVRVVDIGDRIKELESQVSGKDVLGAQPVEDLDQRPLYELAAMIRRDWKNVNFAAKPYLDALGSLKDIDDKYGMDSGDSIVAYFLSNAGSWRGETAKAVKAELRRRSKGGRMKVPPAAESDVRMPRDVAGVEVSAVSEIGDLEVGGSGAGADLRKPRRTTFKQGDLTMEKFSFPNGATVTEEYTPDLKTEWRVDWADGKKGWYTGADGKKNALAAASNRPAVPPAAEYHREMDERFKDLPRADDVSRMSTERLEALVANPNVMPSLRAKARDVLSRRRRGGIPLAPESRVSDRVKDLLDKAKKGILAEPTPQQAERWEAEDRRAHRSLEFEKAVARRRLPMAPASLSPSPGEPIMRTRDGNRIQRFSDENGDVAYYLHDSDTFVSEQEGLNLMGPRVITDQEYNMGLEIFRVEKKDALDRGDRERHLELVQNEREWMAMVQPAPEGISPRNPPMANIASKLTGPQNRVRKQFKDSGATFTLSGRDLVVTFPNGKQLRYGPDGRQVDVAAVA